MTSTRPNALQNRPTLQTANFATLSTQQSQVYNEPQAHCSLDSNTADALEELLQQVGLSSDNLPATPEMTPQVQNANRSLPSRPPPQPWEFQPSKPKRNTRGKPNAPRQENGRFKSQCLPSMEKTLTATATIPTTSEHNATLTMTFHSSPYENLPLYENLSSVMNNTSSFITPSAVVTTVSPYVNVPPVISSSSSTTYTSSNTLVPTYSTFAFLIYEQIACDIITFLVQSSPQSSANTLPLIVLENMLHKHYKPSLVSHIDSLLLATPDRTYITFETLVRSCISFLGIN